MIPIQKLLSRIQWDRDFGCGKFEIGYYDRVLGRVVRVPFSEISIDPSNRDLLMIMDPEGVIQSIPQHRIKEVYKDNELIWQRPR